MVVELWVIRIECGGVDTSGCLNVGASVACFHDMDIGAVLPGEAQAEDLASFEIAALLVDARIVREQLEPASKEPCQRRNDHEGIEDTHVGTF